jgi:hypothetical protein
MKFPTLGFSVLFSGLLLGSQFANGQLPQSQTAAKSDQETSGLRLSATQFEKLNDPNGVVSDPDYPRFRGHWIVKSVMVDGEFSAAQVGQKPNDMITVGKSDEGVIVG